MMDRQAALERTRERWRVFRAEQAEEATRAYQIVARGNDTHGADHSEAPRAYQIVATWQRRCGWRREALDAFTDDVIHAARHDPDFWDALVMIFALNGMTAADAWKEVKDTVCERPAPAKGNKPKPVKEHFAWEEVSRLMGAGLTASAATSIVGEVIGVSPRQARRLWETYGKVVRARPHVTGNAGALADLRERRECVIIGL